jgi:thiol-disulfide isomerase/thioredoxin
MKKHKGNKSSAKAPIPSPLTAGQWTPTAGTGTPEPQKDQTRLAAVRMSADSPRVIELTEHNFASSIDGHPFAVVDFWTPSCAPCRAFAPIFAAAAARNPDILFAKVNTEDQQAIGAQFNIRSIPTLMIFRSNIIVYAKASALQAGALDEVLDAARALDMEQVQRKVVSVDEVALGAPTAPVTDAGARIAADASLLSIETHLSPSLRGPGSALKDAIPRLAAGELIVIRNAFEPDFAERMYRSLDRCTTWRVFEGYEEDFSYHHHNLYHPEEYPADLAWCSKIFDSSRTKEWVTRLSGRSCPGPAQFSASWYVPGDHSLPHNDIAKSDDNLNRQVAYVWHLAKDWRSEWGGALYWCAKAYYLPPVFNTLLLFNVGPGSNHFVTHVSTYAQGKRLAINGWWTGPAATGGPVWKGPDRISTGGSEIEIY